MSCGGGGLSPHTDPALLFLGLPSRFPGSMPEAALFVAASGLQSYSDMSDIQTVSPAPQPGMLYHVPSTGALVLCLTEANDSAKAKCLLAHLLTEGLQDGWVSLAESDFAAPGLNGQFALDTCQTLHLPAAMLVQPVAQLTPTALERVLRGMVADQVALFQSAVRRPRPFAPGQSPVPVSGKVIGTEEIQHLVEASLDGWLTTGRFNAAFERALARFLDVRFVLTTNSGSSANLLALTALTSPLLGERALRPGDEVITVAAGFPTTVNPILQNGLIPVFVDVEIPTYNIDTSLIEAAISPKTRAIMVAHTLGNPYNLAEVTRIARKHDLWLVEDCCDALGSRYQGKMVGTFGDVATLSFYPAHHITMGEGGAVFTNNGMIKRAVESIRDWGRDCWCEPGKDNTCGKRFCWQLGDLPEGYDHKYTYSHLGYNLKISDMQAAVGVAQLGKLDQFIAARRKNFAYLHQLLQPLQDVLILPQPTAESEPSWFGFPITIRPESPVSRQALLPELDKKRIGTRLLFAGNLTRQPYFRDRAYRVAGPLHNTDIVMNHTFWLGVYPGISNEMMSYMVEQLQSCLQSTVAR